VPQDIPGMIKAYGGNDKFEAKLDEMFNSESKTTGREQVDVTGLIGQYAHGNEPSHHMAYLYNYIGKPEKTAEKVQYILDNFYKNTPDGLIGNEDCGQMSAWYVLSSMGIYAVTPGNPEWSLTTPYFKKTKVSFENGNTEEISAENSNEHRKYFGLSPEKRTYGFAHKLIIPVPVIEAENKAFKDKMKVNIISQNPNDMIYYWATSKEDSIKIVGVSLLYKQPFEISKTSTIKVFSKNKENQSASVAATFFKKPNNYTISIKSTYNPQYHAGGPEGLIDGIFGAENWRKGDWQGYQGQDFEAVIDLQKEQSITNFSANFLQDSRSWIMMPTEINFFVSDDNVTFRPIGGTENEDINPKETKTIIQGFGIKKNYPVNARYVKIVAKNFGKLPEWHQGAGGDAFIFIDEITIR
jgi:hypothetical protein